MLVEHYPGVFAAVGVYGPELGVRSSVMRRFGVGRHDGAFSQIDRLAGTPVKVLQGEYDDVPPRDVLNEFIEKIRKVNSSSELEIYPDGTHGTNASEARLYPWLAQHRNASMNPPIQEMWSEALSKVKDVQ
jgi:pimeloyl-ACP methyl ester carboxylesterase